MDKSLYWLFVCIWMDWQRSTADFARRPFDSLPNPFYCNLCNFSSADGMEAKKIERHTVVDFMRISAKWQTMRLSTKLLLTTGIECLFVQRLWNFVCVSAHRIDVRLHHSRQKMILNAWRTTAAGWADEWLSDISLKSFYAYSWNS